MGSSGGEELSELEIQSPRTPFNGHEEKIQVSVRVRPLNEKEMATHDFVDWECIDSTTVVFKNVMAERNLYPNAYTYDRVFGPNSSTREVYDEAAKEVALSVVNGINSSIFAYGQTSSGKTYTMVGITQYTIEDIFNYVEEHDERKFVLKFSAMEIYNEAVRDLLSEDTASLRLLDDPERGTVVEKLTEETLRDKGHLLELIAVCEAQRQIGETSLNEVSSRSHQILRLMVESSARQLEESANLSTLSAIANFVDLAGSERSTQSVGTRLKEGCHINRSLLTLGTVIRKLSKGRNGHVPFRDSKLTRILQHSLGGNARTAVICTLSPAHKHVEQSRNTLTFATSAKEVGTNARVNVVMSDKALVKQLRKELARLAGELKSMSLEPSKAGSSKQLRDKELQIEKMSNEIKELSYQRDLAQARIEELLSSTGQEEEASRNLDTSRRLLVEHQRKISWLDDSLATSDHQQLDTSLKTSKSLNYLREQDTIDLLHNNLDLQDNLEGQFLINDCSPQFPDKPPEFSVPDPLYENSINTTHGDIEDSWKEVRCIEVGNVSTEKESDTVPSKQSETEPIPSATEYNALENRIRELQTTIDNLVTQSPANNLSNSASVNSPRINLTTIRDSLHFTDTDQDQKLEKSQQDELNVEQDTSVSASSQLQDFELQQKKLITLWDVCHTSLVHRTYFFLLFTGSDQSDSMYMEIELRRLSFIQTKFSQGESIRMDGQILTPSSSMKVMNQEREMLSRQMSKKFTTKEREALFIKWGIRLDTKKRRIQLARRLWTNPNDMKHIRESAELVAKLCGFTKGGQVPKEMFVGPNFASKSMCKKSYSLRDSFSFRG